MKEIYHKCNKKEQRESEDWFRLTQHSGVGAQSKSEPLCGSYLIPLELNPQKRKTLHLILLLAEELTAVPAMVAPFCERKPHGAARAAVTAFVLHPVVCSRTAWLVTYRPAENSASTVTNEDPTVIPAGDTTESPQGWPQHSLLAEALFPLLLRLSSFQWECVWEWGSCAWRHKKNWARIYTSISTLFGSNLAVSLK